MSLRLPRFHRVSTIAPIKLTERDSEIIRQIHRHRFLRSNQIIGLVGGSPQQIVRRLQLLFHHGYLARPRTQLQYYERNGSKPFAYGLGNNGGEVLRQSGLIVNSNAWNEKNHVIGRMYLEHTLFVAEVMVSLELASRRHGIKLLYEDQLGGQSFRWRVKVQGIRLGVISDRVFALEYTDSTGMAQRVYFFLEADRGTMPVIRKKLIQTSFYRKLLAYEATWTNKIHQRHLGIPRFRVLTITTSMARVDSLLDACSQLKRGHGLFLFADRSVLEKDLFSPVWLSGKTGELSPLLDLLFSASSPVS